MEPKFHKQCVLCHVKMKLDYTPRFCLWCGRKTIFRSPDEGSGMVMIGDEILSLDDPTFSARVMKELDRRGGSVY